MIKEIEETLRNTFKSLDEAYTFFATKKGNTHVTLEQFSKGIHYLFPKRFYESDIIYFFNSLKEENDDDLSY